MQKTFPRPEPLGPPIGEVRRTCNRAHQLAPSDEIKRLLENHLWDSLAMRNADASARFVDESSERQIIVLISCLTLDGISANKKILESVKSASFSPAVREAAEKALEKIEKL